MERSWDLFVKKNWDRMRELKIGLGNMNSVRFNGTESISHLVTKTLICYLLFEGGHYFKTEQTIGDARCDVIDLSTFTVYEIETLLHSSTVRRKMKDYSSPAIEDLIIVDLRKMDLEWEPVMRMRDLIGRKLNIGN